MQARWWVFLVLAGALLGAGRAQAQVIVIANPGVKAVAVSKDDLRDLFTGATSSLKGESNTVPVLLKAGAAHEEFLASIVGKNDGAFRASWRSLVFSGQATMPRTFDSEAAMVEFVARTAGAIGYIGKATPHEGVKVLAVR
jgi:ABC-type phosphate transport system substrate-binding protein